MSIQDSLTKPLESFTSPPLTPPPTDEKSKPVVSPIVQAIKNLEAGKASTSSCAEFRLEPEGYKNLLQRLQSNSDESLWGFVRHKLRYDYSPSSNKLLIRIPKPMHESLIKSVVNEIERQLKSISDGEGPSAEFAKEVESDRSATIEFDEQEYGHHDPDGQFRHTDANYPGVILEVAYSQNAKDLPRLADDYILGSDGDIYLCGYLC